MRPPAWSGAAQVLVDAMKDAGDPGDADVAGNGRAPQSTA